MNIRTHFLITTFILDYLQQCLHRLLNWERQCVTWLFYRTKRDIDLNGVRCFTAYDMLILVKTGNWITTQHKGILTARFRSGVYRCYPSYQTTTSNIDVPPNICIAIVDMVFINVIIVVIIITVTASSIA